MKKICHISSVHFRYDTRIFYKECQSLVQSGYQVTLVVSDGKGDEVQSGVKILDVGDKSDYRLFRMLQIPGRIFLKAKLVDADLYHFHDPELIPVGLRLKRLGKRVIYDVHEDVPRQIMGKHYLPYWIKPIVKGLFERYENHYSRKFDALLTATSHIRSRFEQQGISAIDVNNYPICEEFHYPPQPTSCMKMVAYVGGISRLRGVRELILALEGLDCGLFLAGRFDEAKFDRELRSLPSWGQVEYLGFASRDEVARVLASSIAGIVTLQPAENYRFSQPVKLYEYMAAGLPVIASNFSQWRSIVEGHNCGICVESTQPQAIAEALSYFLQNPDEARRMGENGRRLVEGVYSWEQESLKVLSVYDRLVDDRP